MIAADQPNCFPPELLVALSSTDDGTMLDRALEIHDNRIMANRQAFCHRSGVDYDDVVFQYIVYDNTQTYDRIVEVGSSDTTRSVSGVEGDVLLTKQPGVGLLLPVADCVATVVYDPVHRILAMLHLGRHSSLTTVIAKTIAHVVDGGSNPADLIVWMSPNIHQSHYRLEYFDKADDPKWARFIEQTPDGIYLDIQGYNKQQFINCSVREENIHESSLNTAESTNYFSHSQGDARERFAVLAMMR